MYGYSDSEESDDYRRPRVPPGVDPNKEQKKTLNRRYTPQETINGVWKRFSVRTPSSVSAILPFDPVKPPAAEEERANEPVSASYERAKEECARRVNRIIKECRRINKRYSDSGWDISWDLQTQVGNTLNSLCSTTFDVAEAAVNPKALAPKAVKRVHEIFEKPTFLEKVSPDQVKQGAVGNCWAIGSLIGLSSIPEAIKRLCVAYDTRIGIYGFVFYRDGKWIYSIIDDRLFLTSPVWDAPSMHRQLLQQIDTDMDAEKTYRQTYHTGSKALFFGSNTDENETWVPLLEKAYAKAHGDYASLDGGWTGEGLEDMSGGVSSEILTADILDPDAFWENELRLVNKEFLFGCSTGITDGGGNGSGSRDGIAERHAYVVTDVRTLSSGVRLVKLRNPWGKARSGLWHGPWSDGSAEWTAEVQKEVGHRFGSDSSFWISYDDFLRKWQHIDRTRLFRDADWMCSQHWIGVDVPWKAHYHERFRFELTHDSAVVIVLSQLNNRYFRDLRGQYSFRLHFRLHQVNAPGAEDYIVRSDSSNLMSRSVSVELPDLPKGRYSVWVMVTGIRNSKRSSIEEIIQSRTRNREDDPKLEQVGLAYDLAHSRAAAYMAEAERIRKKMKQKKASECRKKHRRERWEREYKYQMAQIKQTHKRKTKIKAKGDKRREAEKKLEEEYKEKKEKRRAERKAREKKTEENKGEKGDQKKPETICNCACTNPKSKSPEPASGSDSDSEPRPTLPADPFDDLYSDSPVSDWEAIYSDDDYTRYAQDKDVKDKVPASIYDPVEDTSATTAPWNAFCVVGLRVYSKDKDLSLGVVVPNGEEWGWPRGERDIDNAQMNASGQRRAGKDEEDVVKIVKIDDGEVTEIDAENMSKMADTSERKSQGKAPIRVEEQSEEDDGDDESEDDETSRLKKTRKSTRRIDSDSTGGASGTITPTSESEQPVIV
ncbi:hypothetical protein TD95_000780 [Thielaviopsis punctulata]|uniref:Calpain catalytic domain-containing protein n=1 Tax=Thielaviopsis punctulata TaxID=72032 RepID=A0A0F4ZAG2_9PEZI|nr:hypothetical protein TD95_000780 [Thielaviopsis punctulata]